MRVQRPPDLRELIVKVGPKRLSELASNYLGTIPSQYDHWDKLRHREPPEGLDHEEWWLVTKLARAPALRPLPLTTASGEPFRYALPDEAQRLLHYIDQRSSGAIAMPEVVVGDDQARQHYLVNSLMEEAIRSSQLEGATTSRQAAKELLRSGRPAMDRSERMILNNYHALQFMRESMSDELSPNAVLELQRILTEGTLDDPNAAGRLQRPDEERITVRDRADGRVVHRPPPAEQLSARLDALCEFANARDDETNFMHPVVRAILLHFWLAYDHPFEDGNGRTARALFYWSMRVQGYWLTEYLSISRILRNAPGKYGRAFLMSETDAEDTTYFILYQLGVVKRAIGELDDYLRRKVAEVREVEGRLESSDSFNHRQLALLSDALRNPEQVYTFTAHARSHGVTHETARNDISALHDRGLLARRRAGRQYVFSPASSLAEDLARVAC
jgi:Fic family protein